MDMPGIFSTSCATPVTFCLSLQIECRDMARKQGLAWRQQGDPPLERRPLVETFLQLGRPTSLRLVGRLWLFKKEKKSAMLLLSRCRYATGVALCVAVGAIGILAPSTAEAHFKLTAPASWLSQDSVGGPQKTGPCAAVPNTALGDSVGTPTKVVTALQSGQTVPVSVAVTVGHPGWFRIALVEGASSTQTLSTLADPQAQMGTNCTPAIMKNPVWSPTQPILADGLPDGSTATTQQTGNQTFQVTIPKSATCTSAKPCTLQVIMVMTDHPASDCYYHHCADISTGSDADAGSDSASAADAAVAKDASHGVPDASGAGGSANSGGGSGQGGGTETGGVMGSGGSASAGGDTGGGGRSAGGVTGSGGSADSGGNTGKGGSAGAGGASGKGGEAGMGGSAGAGGANGSGGSAGAGDSGKLASGCTCGIASRGGGSWGTSAALLGALWALRGRRRRRRNARH